jgi:hypothetical protein
MTTPAPRRRTIADVAAPYSNFLVRVPPAAEGVCAVCHSCSGPHHVCDRCFEAWEELGEHRTADAVAFVSMAPRGEQLARELFAYKEDRSRPVDRQKMTTGLAAVLWKWLGRHERCMAAPLGITSFDVITTVPSTSGRKHHPLPSLVSEVVTDTSNRYETLLEVHRTDLEKRQQAADRYQAILPEPLS